jgi:tRNA nucleotidyltransferase (CCA-adding enzyme)
MTPDQYLQAVLARLAINTSATAPVLSVRQTLMPFLSGWTGQMLRSVQPSGSFVKGTANRSGTDIDLFISLSSQTSETLKQVYTTLANQLRANGYAPKEQNVSINIKVGGYDVDLVPAKHQGGNEEYHSLYRRRADTWTQTNVNTHINTVRSSGRAAEIRVIKLWREQQKLSPAHHCLKVARKRL